MTTPTDSSSDSAEDPTERQIPPHPILFLDIADSPIAREVHHETMRYYSSRFKHELIQEMLRDEYPDLDNAPEFVKTALRIGFPTLALRAIYHLA